MAENFHETIILGAGISGLSCGYFLKSHDLLILEAEKRVGGKFLSQRKDDLLLENGPNALLLRTNEVKDLLIELGLDGRIIFPARKTQKRYICKGNLMVEVNPLSLIFTLTDLHSKFKLITGGFSRKAKKENESINEFFSRKISPYFAKNLIVPLVSGIYAGNTSKLIMKSAFPMIHQWDKTYNSLLLGAVKYMLGRKGHPIKSGICSFPEGMEEVTQKLAEKLKGKIKLNTPVKSVKKTKKHWVIETDKKKYHCNNLITTMPAPQFRKVLTGKQFTQLKDKLKKIYYPWLTLCHFVYRKEDVKNRSRGFGFLCTQDKKREQLGCLFPSHMFPGRVEDGKEVFTIFVGGSLYPEKAKLAKAKLYALVHDELATILDIRTREPERVIAYEWKESIPQYDKNQFAFKKWCEENKPEKENLHFCTNYWGGISTSDCVSTAKTLAEKLMQ
ncbi:protoporphyrinogen oxidase [Candidatus Riflebacteria bacterium]